MSLNDFITESGVQSYVGLQERCTRIGVLPPSNEEYAALRPGVVTSQSDGIVVLDAPQVIDERTGDVLMNSEKESESSLEETLHEEQKPKHRKRRQRKTEPKADQ